MVVAKFKCELKTTYPGARSEVVLKPVTTGSKENQEFYSYTPAGEIKLSMLNPEASKEFIPGFEYYVEFHRAEE